MKKPNFNSLTKKINRKKSHLRWGMEIGKSHNQEMINYYLAFVGNEREISNAKNNLFANMKDYGGLVEILREDFGGVKDTDMNYELFVVESRANSDSIKYANIGIPKVEDKNMYDRKRASYIRKSDGIGQEFSLERYVADLYNK